MPLAAFVATTGNWVPRGPAAVLLTSYVAFALLATWLRRYYRHATQSMRLVLGFAALLAPFVAVYPMTAVLVERTTRTVIERDYAPQTAGQSEDIRAMSARNAGSDRPNVEPAGPGAAAARVSQSKA